jgi:hypothetical protein
LKAEACRVTKTIACLHDIPDHDTRDPEHECHARLVRRDVWPLQSLDAGHLNRAGGGAVCRRQAGGGKAAAGTGGHGSHQASRPIPPGSYSSVGSLVHVAVPGAGLESRATHPAGIVGLPHSSAGPGSPAGTGRAERSLRNAHPAYQRFDVYFRVSHACLFVYFQM